MLTFDCRWEHTPEWSLTSKLLISKHQQVQLLEAASVLLTMNQDSATPPDSANDFQSDQDSASPAASGPSEPQDRASSADTTPPPDMFNAYSTGSYTGRHKRYSSGHGLSRSYQSGPSAANPLYAGSVPKSPGFGHYHQPSHERRPLPSGINADQEDDGLAAAVELLSCSFGSATSRTIPVPLPEDAPPVPHIPAQYLSQGSFSTARLETNHHPRQIESYTRHQVDHVGDVKMEESEESVADDEEYDHRFRGRSDEDDDGVFGRMEE